MSNTTFGAVIRARREAAGMTQKEAASRLSLSPQYLNDIEQGRRNPPPDRTLEQVAQALDIPADYLYFLAGRLAPDMWREWQGREIDSRVIVRAYAAMREVLAKW